MPSRTKPQPVRRRPSRIWRGCPRSPSSSSVGSLSWRLVWAVLVAAGTFWIAPAGSFATSSSPAGGVSSPVDETSVASGVTSGPASVVLLGQTAYVEAPKGVFRMRLKITARDPADDQLRVNVYSRLTTRTGFDDALDGTTRRICDLPAHTPDLQTAG